MTATVRDLIKALQKFPMDTPVFTYNEYDEGDGLVEVVEYYIPTEEDKQLYAESLEKTSEWWAGRIQPPHYCKGDSHVTDYWQKNGLHPVVYIRERGWSEYKDERKEDAICLTVAM